MFVIYSLSFSRDYHFMQVINSHSLSNRRTLSHSYTKCPIVAVVYIFHLLFFVKRLGMVLFIQMQLCTTTLRDWLVKRNENITPGKCIANHTGVANGKFSLL